MASGLIEFMRSYWAHYLGLFLGGALVVAFILLISKLRWYHIWLAILFGVGMIASSFFVYLFSYPILEWLNLVDTYWIFMPFVAGAIVFLIIMRLVYRKGFKNGEIEAER